MTESNAEYADRLKFESNENTNIDQMNSIVLEGDNMQYESSASVFWLILFAVLLVGLGAIFLYALPGTPGTGANSNKTCTCIGLRGEKGEPGNGTDGKDGKDGKDGQDGGNGVCIGNPANPCPKGDKGDNGTQGLKGDTGLGIPGTPCVPCSDGVCLQPCINGSDGGQGLKGDKGDDGVCNCTGNQEFVNVNISGTLNMNGPTACAMPLDSTCFGSAVCRDWSTCTAVFNSIRSFSLLRVAAVGMPDGSGGPGLGATEFIEFGKRDIFAPANQWNVNTFQAYAIQVEIASISNTNLVSGGTLSITSVTSTSIQSGTTIDVEATGDANFDSISGHVNIRALGGGKNINLLSSGVAALTAPSVSLFGATGYQVGRTVADPAFFSSYGNSFDFISGAANVANSVRFSDNPIIQGSAHIGTSRPDGFVQIGPFIKVGGGKVRSSGPIMTLQEDTSVDILSIQAKISNSEVGKPIIFNDADGISFEDTFLTNAKPGSFPLKISDPQGVDFASTKIFDSDGTLDVMGNMDVTSLITTNTLSSTTSIAVASMLLSGSTITGVTNIVSASVTFSGAVNCAGGTCTSDMRTKENVSKMDNRVSLNRIRRLNGIKWTFKPWFEKNKNIVPGTTFYGFSAQDSRKILPQSVSVFAHSIGDRNFTDLHSLKKAEFVPDLVGAVKELDKMIAIDQRDIQHMRRIIAAESTELFKRYLQLTDENKVLGKRISWLEDKLESQHQVYQNEIDDYKKQIERVIAGIVMKVESTLVTANLKLKDVDTKIQQHATAIKLTEGKCQVFAANAKRDIINTRLQTVRALKRMTTTDI